MTAGSGGVDHDRRLDLLGHQVKELCDVGGLVPVGVLQAHVENVRPVAGLPTADFGGLLELALVDETAEAAAAQHVGALADHGRAELVVHQQRVDSRYAGVVGFDDLPGRFALRRLAQQVDVAVDGAAATADQVHPSGIDEAAQGLGHGLRRLVVLAVFVGHARVGHAGHREAGDGRQGADVVGHERRASGAVDADPQQFAVGQGDVQGLHVLPGQQRAHGFDGALHRHRHLTVKLGEGAVDSLETGLDVQGVLPRLQQQNVNAALDQPGGLDVVAVHQFVEGHAASDRDGLCRRPHGACDKPRLFSRGSGVGDFAGQPGGHAVQSAGLVGQVILGQHDGGGAEGVGFNDVRASVEVPPVDGLDDVRARQRQVFVASLVFEAPEIIGAEIEGLDGRAHRAVDDENALSKRGFKG